MTKEKDCVFCKIRRGEIETNLLFDDNECFVILDIFPSAKGHMLVIAKKHYENLLDSPDKIVSHMFSISKKFAKSAKEKLKASGIKLVINVGRDADQLVDHMHIHILPFYPKSDQYGHNKILTNDDAGKLMRLLSKVNNAHAFERHNLGTYK